MPTSVTTDLRDALSRAMRSAGMTTRELAGKAGIDPRTVDNLDAYSRLKTVFLLASALGVPVVDLFGAGDAGHRLGEVRARGGLTREDLARHLGIELQLVADLEHGGLAELETVIWPTIVQAAVWRREITREDALDEKLTTMNAEEAPRMFRGVAFRLGYDWPLSDLEAKAVVAVAAAERGDHG